MIDEAMNASFLLFRQCSSEQHDSAESACFGRDSSLTLIEVTSYLNSDKAYEEAEDNSQGRQHSRRECFEDPSALVVHGCEPSHNQAYRTSDKISDYKDDECHPRHRKIKQSVAHVQPPRSTAIVKRL